MEILIAFAVTLAIITLVSVKWRISPFFTLIGGSILFGLLAGLTPDETFLGIVSGVGKVFSAFGIIILCGAVIARLLQEQGLIGDIVSDIRGVVDNPRNIAGISGYILSVPITCCITAYIMLLPILESCGKDRRMRNTLLYLAAIGGIISYALVYPTPVTIPLFQAFSGGTSALLFDAVSIPLSLAVLAAVLAGFWWAGRKEASRAWNGSGECRVAPAGPAADRRRFHWRAWTPFIVIMAAIPAGLFGLGLSHASLINFIMIAGAAAAIVMAQPEVRASGLSSAAKHAGLIIFDICGAGALGFVIVQSGFAGEILGRLTLLIPVILVPFVLAALIETAQGSRVVTAVITAEVLAGTTVTGAIHPVPLILLISAGSCIVSYVTDPFFWLVQRTTGDDMSTVVRCYTLPVALAGLAILAAALALEFFVFG